MARLDSGRAPRRSAPTALLMCAAAAIAAAMMPRAAHAAIGMTLDFKGAFHRVGLDADGVAELGAVSEPVVDLVKKATFAFDIDRMNGKVYWVNSDATENAEIGVMDVDGSNQAILGTGAGNVNDVKVAPAQQQLWYARRQGGAPGICMADLTQAPTVGGLKVFEAGFAESVELDLTNNMVLFWDGFDQTLRWGSMDTPPSTGAVGTLIHQHHPSATVVGFALDRSENPRTHVYLASNLFTTIERWDFPAYDAASPALANKVDIVTGRQHMLAMAMHSEGQRLYWLQYAGTQGGNSLYSTSTPDGGAVDLVTVSPSTQTMYAFAIFDEIECPAGLMLQGGACVCGAGTYEDDGNCVSVTECGAGEEEAVAPTPTSDRVCAACGECPIGDMLVPSTSEGCFCTSAAEAFFDVWIAEAADAQECSTPHVVVGDITVVREPERPYLLRIAYENDGNVVDPAPFNFIDGKLSVSGGLMHVRDPPEGVLTITVLDLASATEVLTREWDVTAVCAAADSTEPDTTFQATTVLAGYAATDFDDAGRQTLFNAAISNELGLDAAAVEVAAYEDAANGLAVTFDITAPRDAAIAAPAVQATLDVGRVLDTPHEHLAAKATARLLSRAVDYCCHAELAAPRVAAPKMSEVAGERTLTGALSITVQSVTPGAIVRVTIDGSNPSSSLSASTSGGASHTVSIEGPGTVTVKAIATHTQLADSPLTVREYTFPGPPSCAVDADCPAELPYCYQDVCWDSAR
uniref:GH29D-like beta-sandwich domain-containing protein n=2 Tax=Bicosoecida sp. CB-2014 TaxID=1486930 RepID=A0A7S1GAR2_9STRA|mmetsp:Transcript_24107/g.83704  ORF Transcript_24107/g.83704 Transcript_24107/m.83704 type:complete len:748 (+) Transcript_24107:247-2490(+)